MNGSIRRSVIVGGTAALLVAGFACSGGTRLGSPTDYQMWLHFEQAGRIQSAMIQGDLPTARVAARTLAASPAAPGIGPEGAEWVEALSEQARSIRDAPTFGEAAGATGLLAATCGSCHEASGGGPVFRHGDPPADQGFSGHMILHSWAADRMWEGLVANAGDAWAIGAAVFADGALDGQALTPKARGYAERLHQLGLTATDLDDLTARGERYGEMLEQCSGCHAELGVGS